MKFDDSNKPQIRIDADYVVEWYVENNQDRYRKLTLSDSLRDFVPDKNDRPVIATTHAAVCIVLEVPLRDLEPTTAQLRRSSKLRDKAPYLLTAASFAVEGARIRDQSAIMEKIIEAQREQIMAYAKKLDAVEEAMRNDGIWPRMYQKTTPARSIGIAHQEHAARRIAEIGGTAARQLGEIRAALEEKRTNVAAKLLCEMDDDEDGR